MTTPTVALRETWVPMDVQPPEGWDGEHYVADEIRNEGQWLNVVECGHPVLKLPYKPGDSMPDGSVVESVTPALRDGVWGWQYGLIGDAR